MNGNYFDWIRNNGNPSADRLMFGFVPAYPVFMFAGIILVIIVSIIKLKLKGIPLREFELGILIVVPLGILGATIFGKMFLPGVTWYHIFFFWEPGMSLFGSLLFGSTAGFAWFYYRSRQTLISVWVYADCIIPNILLGQMLGRWGNFYNHEILGQVVSFDSLSWLPGFIKERLFYFPDLAGFNLPSDWWSQIQNQGMGAEVLNNTATFGAFHGLTLKEVLTSSEWLTNSDGSRLDPALYNYGVILYRSPLFLIEGFGNFLLWILITFVVANLGRWFAHPKPWDLQPKAYPGWYNKKYPTLKETLVEQIPTQVPVKYQKVVRKDEFGRPQTELKLGFYQAWNKAYYWFVPSENETRKFEVLQEKREKFVRDNLKKLEKNKEDYRYQKQKLKSQVQKNKVAQKTGFKNLKENYLVKKTAVQDLIGHQWQRIIWGNPDGRALEKINNPHQFFVLRCGVATGSYVVGYLILRIILETQRLATELMIQNQPVADFLVLGLILVAGILLVVSAQFVAPYRYREVNWLYEKSY